VPSLRTTGFVDFVLRPEYEILENTMFWTLDLFSSSRGEREIPALLGPLERVNINLRDPAQSVTVGLDIMAKIKISLIDRL
jgi:hypothetical protein